MKQENSSTMVPSAASSSRVQHTPPKQKPGYSLMNRGRITPSKFYDKGRKSLTPCGTSNGLSRSAHTPKSVSLLYKVTPSLYVHIM